MKKNARAQTLGPNIDGLTTTIFMFCVQQRIHEIKIKEGLQMKRMSLQCLKLTQVNRLGKELPKTDRKT